MKVSIRTDTPEDSRKIYEYCRYRNIDWVKVFDGVQVKWIAPRDFGHITISLDGTKNQFEFHLQHKNDKDYQLSIRRRK